MGLGSILIAVVKFLLKSVLFVLKAVLYGGKLFLLLFVLVARVFLIFAKAAVPPVEGSDLYDEKGMVNVGVV